MHIKMTSQEVVKLRDIAAEAVGTVFYNKSDEKKLAKLFGINALAHSFVNNLKDTLYHYKMMDNNINDVINNETNSDFSKAVFHFKHLEEHLIRGLVDLYVGILQSAARYYTAYIRILMNDKSGYIKNTHKLIQLSRHNLHICKNHVYNLRVKRLCLFITSETDVHFNENFLDELSTVIKSLIISQLEINETSRASTENTKYLKNVYATVLLSALHGGKICQINKNTSIHTITYPTSVTEKEFRKLNPEFKKIGIGEALPIHYWYVMPG